MCAYHCACTTVVHNTAKNSSDSFPSYPPDNHHSLDVVCWTGREEDTLKRMSGLQRIYDMIIVVGTGQVVGQYICDPSHVGQMKCPASLAATKNDDFLVVDVINVEK